MDEMADRFQNLLYIRDKLIQKEKQKKEHEEQQKEKLCKLRKEHELFCLQKNHELAELQTELREAKKETLDWKEKWMHIQEKGSAKKIEIGQIMMATNALYEKTGEFVETVGATDTKKQLDEIKEFIQDYDTAKQMLCLNPAAASVNGPGRHGRLRSRPLKTTSTRSQQL